MEREQMEFDVVIVGGGPAGLACAIALAQQASESGTELEVALVEKGSEIGAHIVSGAVIETRALDELLPHWRERGAPITTRVADDRFFFLHGEHKSRRLPSAFIPKPMRNEGNYIVSLANVCRWLGEQAEALGVHIFPAFAAAELIIEDQVVRGVITGDRGITKHGQPGPNYEPGYALRAKYTVLAEGAHGHLGKQVIKDFGLRDEKDPQHYGIGLKELWRIDKDRFEAGLVVHTLGWPAADDLEAGGFLYCFEEDLVSVGYVVALNYENPYIDPFMEFQRWKHHPEIARFLEGGERLGYGARALNKGGFTSLPRLVFPGGLLIGCDAGFLNPVKIKGTHTAIKTGSLAGKTLASAIADGAGGGDELVAFSQAVESSWVWDELAAARNFEPALSKFGTTLGAAFTWVDQNVFGGRLPFTWNDPKPDHAQLEAASAFRPIDYPKPDGKISFDRLSSVFLSNTNHEEDQPSHLKLRDEHVPVAHNLPTFAGPAQRYCPAAVYEYVEAEGATRFRINAQNCVHCKTCDIKDPAQNIVWVPPEGGGGPNYGSM